MAGQEKGWEGLAGRENKLGEKSGERGAGYPASHGVRVKETYIEIRKGKAQR